MDELSEIGRTVFLVSHNMNSIGKLCKRAILFKNGKVDLNKSVDWKMHLTGKAKREKENAITNLLKEQSIDCRLHNNLLL